MPDPKRTGLDVFDGIERRKKEAEATGAKAHTAAPGVPPPPPTTTRRPGVGAFKAHPPPPSPSGSRRADVAASPAGETSAHAGRALSSLPPSAGRLVALLVAALALAVVLFVALRPRFGGVLITVTGPGGRATRGVRVFVDGEKRCDSSPCRVGNLTGGPHLVRAAAEGHVETADRVVKIQEGETEALHIALVSAHETGLEVSARSPGLRLWVDGKDRGLLPARVPDLQPGKHRIRVGGHPRFAELEQDAIVEAGVMKAIGPLEPRVVRGQVTLLPGEAADGARVVLGERRVPHLPATIEVPAGEPLELEATKPGFEPFRRTVSFDDGVAVKRLEIALRRSGNGVPAQSPASRATGEASPPANAAGSTDPNAPTSAGANRADPATLSMNSIPASTVILDGRPLGTTPKAGVRVRPGPHTVVFVHPEYGRKVVSGVLQSGENKAFTTQFP